MGDDSAPRENVRQSKAVSLYAEIQANILLMSAHRCEPYPHPISAYRYLIPALDCNATHDPRSAQCNRDNWKPSERPIEPSK